MSWGPSVLARRALMLGLAIATNACTTYGVVTNKPLLPAEGHTGYALGEFAGMGFPRFLGRFA